MYGTQAATACLPRTHARQSFPFFRLREQTPLPEEHMAVRTLPLPCLPPRSTTFLQHRETRRLASPCWTSGRMGCCSTATCLCICTNVHSSREHSALNFTLGFRKLVFDKTNMQENTLIAAYRNKMSMFPLISSESLFNPV